MILPIENFFGISENFFKSSYEGSNFTEVNGSVVKNNLNIKGAKQFKTNGQIAEGKMPDVKGYDITSAINILEKSGLKVVVKGNGYVAQQSIPAGNKIKKGQTVTLTLKI